MNKTFFLKIFYCQNHYDYAKTIVRIEIPISFADRFMLNLKPFIKSMNYNISCRGKYKHMMKNNFKHTLLLYA